MNNIDMVFYINLDHRTDRRQQIEEELNKMDIKYERFCAISRKPPNGHIGCALSHIGILKIAKERGYNNILIFEDDFKFLVNKDEYHKLLSDFFSLNIDYNILMLSYDEIRPSNPINNIISEITNMNSTSGYIIHNSFFDVLINTYMESVELSEKSNTGMFAIDMLWKKHQGKDSKFYRFNTRIGLQRNSFSDITQLFSNQETRYASGSNRIGY